MAAMQAHVCVLQLMPSAVGSVLLEKGTTGLTRDKAC